MRETGDDRLLEAVGVTQREEQVYRLLLQRPGPTVPELARLAATSQPQLRKTLESLQAKGLVSRSATKSPRFSPARPDLAVEVLILQQQERLQRARLAAVGLVDRFFAAARDTTPVELVEVVAGPDAVVQQFEQLQRGAEDEVLLFDKPPYALVANEAEFELLGRGIRYRVVYDRTACELPGQLDVIHRAVDAGELARVTDGVPLKVAIADHRLALVPLSIDAPDVERGVLIHASPLLEAVRMLFELLWSRAVPLTLGAGDRVPDAGAQQFVSESDRSVLALFAAGLKDDAIASQLGVGRRTVQRRMRRMMDVLGVRSRVQLVLEAARQGWI